MPFYIIFGTRLLVCENFYFLCKDIGEVFITDCVLVRARDHCVAPSMGPSMGPRSGSKAWGNAVARKHQATAWPQGPKHGAAPKHGATAWPQKHHATDDDPFHGRGFLRVFRIIFDLIFMFTFCSRSTCFIIKSLAIFMILLIF